MFTIKIDPGEEGRRLDRYLKKYLRAAPLSLIYSLIRKSVRVNGKRVGIDYMLVAGDEIIFSLSDERIAELRYDGRTRSAGAMSEAGGRGRSFTVVYEDERLLVCGKPYGLLTHGDSKEKKKTLVNEVMGYLAAKGEGEGTGALMFTPSPVNRLDRNTSGIVVFGKDAKAVRDFNKMIAERDCVGKYYLTIVAGSLERDLVLTDRLSKDRERNIVSHHPEEGDEGKDALTVARPVEALGAFTLAEIELHTGRTHQIRAHLAAAGYPLIGDPKYGNPRINRRVADRYGLSTQFLHANRMRVIKGRNTLEYLSGTEFVCPLPERLENVLSSLRK